MTIPQLKKRFKKVLRSPKQLLLAAVLIVLGATLLFANKGIWRHAQLRREVGQQEAVLAGYDLEEKGLQSRVDQLRSAEPLVIERIARERYQMRKPGETIYRQADQK